MTKLTPEEWKRMQKPVKRHKYGARRTTLPGEDRSFPSKLEAAVYAHCKLREVSGEIKNLARYASVKLSAAQISYKPDARATYTETNQDFWIEAKGVEDNRFRVIKKLWSAYGPGPLEIYKGKHDSFELVETLIPKGSK